jgi:hypothetical protein
LLEPDEEDPADELPAEDVAEIAGDTTVVVVSETGASTCVVRPLLRELRRCPACAL